MKKAQIETMGLVIIVVLLAFILIFVLQISVKPTQNNLNARYLEINADNLRSTILKTNICENVNIKDELVNCNDPYLAFTQCQNINCNELKNIIKKIIENSLNVTRKYKFVAGSIIIEKDIKSCNSLYTAAQEPIPYSNLNITLAIC